MPWVEQEEIEAARAMSCIEYLKRFESSRLEKASAPGTNGSSRITTALKSMRLQVHGTGNPVILGDIMHSVS